MMIAAKENTRYNDKLVNVKRLVVGNDRGDGMMATHFCEVGGGEDPSKSTRPFRGKLIRVMPMFTITSNDYIIRYDHVRGNYLFLQRAEGNDVSVLNCLYFRF